MSSEQAVQARKALEIANEVRSRRSRLKAEIAAGHRRVQPLIGSPPWWLRTARVTELLAAVPQLGPATIRRRILGPLQIPEGRQLGRMRLSERLALIACLDARESGAAGKRIAAAAQRAEAA